MAKRNRGSRRGKRFRTKSIRLIIVLAVVLVGAAAVGAVELLQQQEAAGSSEPKGDCETGEYPRSSVTVRAAVEVDGVDNPRISSDVVIRAPRSWDHANDLLGDPAHGAYRVAMRCLLGSYDTDFSVYRSGPPTVTVSGGEVVVHDHVWTDLVKEGSGPVGVLDLTIKPDRPWQMAVVSRGGLSHSESWHVTIAAPPDWLEAAVPQPWPPHDAKPGELTWVYGVTSPTGEYVNLAVVELTPDVRATTTVWEGSTAGDLTLTGTDAVSAATFLVVVLLFVRRMRKLLPPDAGKLVRRARLVTIPLLALQFLGLCIEITRVILSAHGDQVPDWSTAAWAADIAVGVTVVVIAGCYGVRRNPRFAALRTIAAALALGWLLRGSVAFVNTRRPDYALLLRLSESTMVFVVTLSAVAALIHAFRALTRSDGKRPDRAWWIWPVAAAVAAGLLLERVWTALQNDSLQRWIYDPAPMIDTLRNAFRFTLWSLPAAWLWLFAVIPAIAVYVLTRVYVEHQPTPDRRTLLMLSLALVIVGPAPWSVPVYGFDLPLWALVATVFWLSGKAGTTVLDRHLRSGERVRDYVARRSPATVRHSARRWLEHRTEPSTSKHHPDLPKRVTPVDVVLALGPGDTPRENMKIMVKFSLWPGVAVSLAIYFFREIARADFTAALPDSLILGYSSDFAWYTVSWVFAAGALGLFWQYLPGKRGPLKVLPLVLADSVGSTCLFVVPKLTGASTTTDVLIDSAVFAVVLLFLGLAMDIRTLRNLGAAKYLTLQEGVAAYGVSNLPSRITAALAPVSAVVAIIFTIIAGPQGDAKPEVQPQSPEFAQNKPTTAIK